ncbi:MAG: hypothetical protein ACI3V5_00725 [Faecousia sp.]
MRRSVLALLLVFLCLLSACSSVPQETSAPTTEQTIETTAAETEPSETTPDIAVEKEVIVYFANWYLDTKTAEEGAEVCSIPWDKVTCINHAFWARILLLVLLLRKPAAPSGQVFLRTFIFGRRCIQHGVLLENHMRRDWVIFLSQNHRIGNAVSEMHPIC